MLKYRIVFLFAFSWTKLFSQTVSVSTTLTNVLYQWIDNPLIVVVENNSCKNLIIKANKGQVKGSKCAYIYVASSDTINQDIIKVGLKQNGKVRWISETNYRVKKLPDPGVYIGTFTDTHLTNKNVLLAQAGLRIPIADGFCSYTNDKVQKLTSYSLNIYRENILLYTENLSDNLLSETTKEFILTKCLTGDKIIFSNFTCLLYEKEKRELTQQIKLTLNERTT